MTGEESTESGHDPEDPRSPKKPEAPSFTQALRDIQFKVRPLNLLGEERLREELRRVRLERRKSDLKLSKTVGYGALAIMAGQLVVADVAFYFYGLWNHWRIPSSAIEIWLGAIVIQVVGVVLVVARYLFPATGRDDNAGDDNEKRASPGGG